MKRKFLYPPFLQKYWQNVVYNTRKTDKIKIKGEKNMSDLEKIEYEEFLKKIDFEKREKYDGKHFIVILSPDDIDELINK